MKQGSRAKVSAPHLADRMPKRRGGARATDALDALMVIARGYLRSEELPYLDLVATRIEGGNLSERMQKLLKGARTPAALRTRLRPLMMRLADCLVQNEPFDGKMQ